MTGRLLQEYRVVGRVDRSVDDRAGLIEPYEVLAWADGSVAAVQVAHEHLRRFRPGVRSCLTDLVEATGRRRP